MIWLRYSLRNANVVDGDHSLVTNNKTLIKCAERNCKNILPLYYDMGKAESIEINNPNICTSLQNAFKYGNIGVYSNKITNIWNDGNYKEEVHLPLIMLLTAMNNYSIDSAKTLEMVEFAPEVKLEYDELLKKANGRMPYFFQFAKDKDKTLVCDKIDLENENAKMSTVNMICEEIEKCNNTYKYDMSKVGTFNVTFLLSEGAKFKNIDLDTPKNKAFIEKYEEIDLNKNKRIIALKDKEDDQFAKDVFNVYTVAKNDLLHYMRANGINEIDGVNILVKYLFKVKSNCKKTLLFNCFEDILLNNLQNNLKDKAYGYCECCGEKFEKKTINSNQKYCDACAKEIKKEQNRLSYQRKKQKK